MFTSVITNQGRILQNKQVAGATIKFTRVVAGTDVIPVVDLRTQTAIVNIKQVLSIQSIKQNNEEQTYTIQVLLENTKLAESYNLSQVGFYATDPDDGEILYAVAQLDVVKKIESTADMPGYTLEMNFKFQNSGNATVEMNFNPDELMTREGVNAIVKETQESVEISGAVDGNVINIKDSTDAPLLSLKVFGKKEQETTTGKNLLDLNDVTISGSTDYTFENIKKMLLAPGTYTASCDFKQNGTVTRVGLSIRDYDDEMSELNTDYSYVQKGKLAPTFTVAEGCNGIQIYAYSNVSGEVAETNCNFMNFQIETGEVATEHEKYTGGMAAPNLIYPQDIIGSGNAGSIKVDTYSENLLDLSTMAKQDCNILDAETGSVQLNIVDNYYALMQTTKYSDYILKNQGVPLTFAVDDLKGYAISMILYGERTDGGTYMEAISEGENRVTIIPTGFISVGILELRIGRKSSIHTDTTTIYTGLRLFVGDYNGEYRPYKNSNANIPIDTPLYEGDYMEVYVDGTGKLYREYIEVVFDGSADEGWNIDYTSDDAKRRMVTSLVKDVIEKTDNGQVAEIWCDKFIKGSANDTYSSIERISVDDIGRIHIYSETYNNVVTDWTTYLSGNPMKVVCKLANPSVTDLTPEQVAAFDKIYTFEPVTNIFGDAVMKVQYFKNNANGKASGTLANGLNTVRSMIGDINSLLDAINGEVV